MAVWNVLIRVERAETGRARSGPASAERAVFVRDGFSFAALLFAPLVLARHRLWLAMAGYGSLLVLLILAALLLRLPENVPGLVLLGAHVLIALELPELRMASLRRRGFLEAGAVVAPRLEEAERRFFENYDPPAAASTVIPPRHGYGRAPADTILGSFPEPRAS